MRSGVEVGEESLMAVRNWGRFELRWISCERQDYRSSLETER